MAQKRPVEVERTVGDYRRSLIQQLATQMLNLRLREIARQPNAPFLSAQAGGSGLGRSVELYELEATVQEGRLTHGLEALIVEARRMQQFGFSREELERAQAAMLAFYERAFKERDKSESPAYAGEYVRAFLEQEPIPGIEFEYKIASTFLPVDHARRSDGRSPEADARREPGRPRRWRRRKKESPVPTEAALRATMAKAEGAPVEAYTDALAGRDLVEKPPAPGKVTARRTVPEIGATVLTLSNGVEVWLKPTDFKNDQVLISAYALGGTSLASRAGLSGGESGDGARRRRRHRRSEPGRSEQAARRQDRTGVARRSATTRTASADRPSPRDLETALQLNYLAFTAPNLTREAFELLKRRIVGALENQAQNPRLRLQRDRSSR